MKRRLLSLLKDCLRNSQKKLNIKAVTLSKMYSPATQSPRGGKITEAIKVTINQVFIFI